MTEDTRLTRNGVRRFRGAPAPLPLASIWERTDHHDPQGHAWFVRYSLAYGKAGRVGLVDPLLEGIRDAADECVHGALPTDRALSCGCWLSGPFNVEPVGSDKFGAFGVREPTRIITKDEREAA